MDYKLPYYMAYPTPLAYDDERKERQDIEYMRSMYPDMVKRILPFVEDECDRMEYEGSMIYDEYPDRLSIQLMCSRICDRLEEIGVVDDSDMNMPDDMMPADEMQAQQRYMTNQRKRNRDKEGMRNIVEVLLLHELMKRRNDNRRRKRQFYPGWR